LQGTSLEKTILQRTLWPCSYLERRATSQ
jgi:hypothetical protein